MKTGLADPTELRKVFNCTRHPRFISRELNEDQIFFLYLQNFSERNNGFISKQVKKFFIFRNGMITMQELALQLTMTITLLRSLNINSK